MENNPYDSDDSSVDNSDILQRIAERARQWELEDQANHASEARRKELAPRRNRAKARMIRKYKRDKARRNLGSRIDEEYEEYEEYLNRQSELDRDESIFDGHITEIIDEQIENERREARQARDLYREFNSSEIDSPSDYEIMRRQLEEKDREEREWNEEIERILNHIEDYDIKSIEKF